MLNIKHKYHATCYGRRIRVGSITASRYLRRRYRDIQRRANMESRNGLCVSQPCHFPSRPEALNEIYVTVCKRDVYISDTGIHTARFLHML